MRVILLTSSDPQYSHVERLDLNRSLTSGSFGDPATDQIVKLHGTPELIGDRHRESLRLVRAVKHHQDSVVAKSTQEHVDCITRENLHKVPSSQCRLPSAEGDERLHSLQERRVL